MKSAARDPQRFLGLNVKDLRCIEIYRKKTLSKNRPTTQALKQIKLVALLGPLSASTRARPIPIVIVACGAARLQSSDFSGKIG